MEKWYTDEEFVIFNKLRKGFLIEDAKFHLKEFIEWVYADDELFDNFDYENVDYDELVYEFENKTDEYTADKDLWDEIIRRYCDDYIKERCAE